MNGEAHLLLQDRVLKKNRQTLPGAFSQGRLENNAPAATLESQGKSGSVVSRRVIIKLGPQTVW